MSDDYVPHAWLDLLDVDGPFLSRPALTEQLDRAWPPRLGRDIRDIVAPTAHEPSPDWSDLEANVNRLLTDVLGYRPGRTITFDAVDVQHAHHPRASVRVHAVCHPSGKSDAPRMVVISADDTATTPQQFDPTHRHDDHNWRATPVQRAALASSRLGAELAGEVSLLVLGDVQQLRGGGPTLGADTVGLQQGDERVGELPVEPVVRRVDPRGAGDTGADPDDQVTEPVGDQRELGTQP